MKIEWNEPGLGVCHVWKIAENWFGFSTIGVWGTATTFEEAKNELESYVEAFKETERLLK